MTINGRKQVKSRNISLPFSRSLCSLPTKVKTGSENLTHGGIGFPFIAQYVYWLFPLSVVSNYVQSVCFSYSQFHRHRSTSSRPPHNDNILFAAWHARVASRIFLAFIFFTKVAVLNVTLTGRRSDRVLSVLLLFSFTLSSATGSSSFGISSAATLYCVVKKQSISNDSLLTNLCSACTRATSARRLEFRAVKLSRATALIALPAIDSK